MSIMLSDECRDSGRRDASHWSWPGSALPRRTVHLLLALLMLAGLGAVAHAQNRPDDRYRSPRATVRTLYTAITAARINSHAITVAIGCLDLGDQPAIDGAQRATQLEAVLRARDLQEDLVPDSADGTTFVFPQWKELRMAMRRQPDGRWQFDRETVALIPRLYDEAQARLQERNKAAAELNVSPLYASPRATIRAAGEAFRRGDYQTLRHTMDLSDVPLVAREEVGNQLANKLRQILLRQPRIILQAIPDSNFSDPFVWLAHPEGVVELVRIPAGERKGEWVFSRDTVRSIDPLFVAFEDKPYDPDVVASGAVTGEASCADGLEEVRRRTSTAPTGDGFSPQPLRLTSHVRQRPRARGKGRS